MLPDSKEIELGNSNHKASPSAGRNPYSYSSGVVTRKVAGCHLFRQMSSQSGLQKLFQGLVSHELTAYLSILTYFNSMDYGHIIKRM